MKKTALTILLIVSAIATRAQGAYDAWLFSENNYEGTARSVAMGNAFTALGGDLGAVSINPAGSAVAGYAQIVLTPSLTFSTNTAVGVPYEGSADPYFQRQMKSRMTKAGIPNVGFSFNFKTNRTSGLKGITAGFILNRVNSWCEDIYANGTNNQTSFLASVADDATWEIEGLGKTKDAYMQDDAYSYLKWQNVVAYRSGMISAFDAAGQKFAGATETVLTNGNVMQSGEVDQTYGRSVDGNKYEYILNVGANISDFVYIGVNLGVNSLEYNYTHYFKEAATDPSLFENVFLDSKGVEHKVDFNNAMYKHSYHADGTGVFAKLGVIVTPGAGFRLGAAIQTPSATKIKEEWQDMATTEFSDSDFNGNAKSDMGYTEYRFNSPWRANFGAAYSLGKFAVISADYEIAGFGGMKYKIDRHNMSDGDITHFEEVNKDIRETYGAAHQLRIGAEVKPFSILAIRAGYNLVTSAQKKYYDTYYEDYLSLPVSYGHNVAFGAGFNSKKSFFADIACRYTFAQNEFIYPYSDYRESEGILSPEIRSRHSNWKLLLTLGWRF